MPTIEASDGVALYVETHGDGIPLVLSNAMCTTCENYRAQVGPLVEAGAQLILWDLRGHGRSESPADPGAYRMDQVVADLGRVLDWAAPGRAAVVGGVSFGGLASLHFAHRYPARVRGLLLVDTGPGIKNPDAQARWEEKIGRTVSIIENEGLDAFVNSPAAATMIGLRPELPAARSAARAIAAQDPVGLTHFARWVAAAAPSIIDELAGIDIPALVIVGEKDDAYLPAAVVMTAKLPRARRETISGAGHIVNIEASEVFNAAVASFLLEIAAFAPD